MVMLFIFFNYNGYIIDKKAVLDIIKRFHRMFSKTCKHYIITLFSSSECNDSNGIIILKFNFSVYILFRFKSIPWLYLECPFFESNIWRKKKYHSSYMNKHCRKYIPKNWYISNINGTIFIIISSNFVQNCLSMLSGLKKTILSELNKMYG